MAQPRWGSPTEQQRIVARVAELLRWCDTLEAQLHQTRPLGAHHLESTDHQILATEANRNRTWK